MAERSIKDARKLYSEGDKVKARIMKVDTKQRRISLGLKPSYFKDGEESDMDIDDEEGSGSGSDDE